MSDGTSATLPMIMHKFADGRGEKNAYMAYINRMGALNLVHCFVPIHSSHLLSM